MPLAIAISDQFETYLRRELRCAINVVETQIRPEFEEFGNNQANNVYGCKRIQEKLKTRYECPDCRRGFHGNRRWTSSQGVCALIYKTTRLGSGHYRIEFAMYIYGSRCLQCGQLGDMKAYEDEVDRLGEVMGQKLCEGLGYQYPKVPRPQRQSYTVNRRGHQSQYCNACKAGVCRAGRY